MGVNDRIRWELQWHPASGARIRRLVFTWSGVRRLMLALGSAGMAVVTGGLLAGLDGPPARSAFEAAMRQNSDLWAQEEALREQAFDLAQRVSAAVNRGRRMARSADTRGRAWERQVLPMPTRNADNEVVRAWLSERGMLLEALGNELTTGRLETGVTQASLPVPLNSVTALQVADLGSAR